MEFPRVESKLFQGLRDARTRSNRLRAALELAARGALESEHFAPSARSSGTSRAVALRYELRRGGTSAVFKVLDSELHSASVTKIALRRTRARQGTHQDDGPTKLERFLEERNGPDSSILRAFLIIARHAMRAKEA
jgi:hypothetical protein